MSLDWKTRTILDPTVLAGGPTIRGLRIGVEYTFRALSAGVPAEEILGMEKVTGILFDLKMASASLPDRPNLGACIE